MKKIALFLAVTLFSVVSFAGIGYGTYSCDFAGEAVEVQYSAAALVFDGESYFITNNFVELDVDTAYRVTTFDNQVILTVINELAGEGSDNQILSITSLSLSLIDGMYELRLANISTGEDQGTLVEPLDVGSFQVACTKM